jgi:hypothetical protein
VARRKGISTDHFVSKIMKLLDEDGNKEQRLEHSRSIAADEVAATAASRTEQACSQSTGDLFSRECGDLDGYVLPPSQYCLIYVRRFLQQHRIYCALLAGAGYSHGLTKTFANICFSYQSQVYYDFDTTRRRHFSFEPGGDDLRVLSNKLNVLPETDIEDCLDSDKTSLPRLPTLRPHVVLDVSPTGTVIARSWKSSVAASPTHDSNKGHARSKYKLVHV